MSSTTWGTHSRTQTMVRQVGPPGRSPYTRTLQVPTTGTLQPWVPTPLSSGLVSMHVAEAPGAVATSPRAARVRVRSVARIMATASGDAGLAKRRVVHGRPGGRASEVWGRGVTAGPAGPPGRPPGPAAWPASAGAAPGPRAS